MFKTFAPCLAAMAGLMICSAMAAAGEAPAAPAIEGKLYAAVTGPDGSLVGGVGVKSVTFPVDQAGSFNVKFKKNVDQCLLQATSARFGYSVQAAPRNQDKKSVYVYMHDVDGKGGVGSFYLTVLCP